MTKEINDFISIWNHNIYKMENSSVYIVSNSKTHNDLFDFCIEDFLTKYQSIDLKKLILEIDRDNTILKKIIESNKFKENLHYEYHLQNFNNKRNKKFIYSRENRNRCDIIVKREISIINNRIIPTKTFQKDIDYAIAKEYMLIKEFDFFIDSYNPYKFIFYQLSLYKNKPLRIKKWYNIIQSSEKFITDFDRFSFLSTLYKFFVNYDKLETEYQKLIFWHKHYKQNSKFEYFNDYFKYENLINYGENLISIFKSSQFDSLKNEFEKKLKKSINRTDFIKSQIKENEKKLTQPDRTHFGENKGYQKVNKDLINGNRDFYYNNIKDAKDAGETEAIIDFIKHLNNLTVKTKRKNSISKNITSKTTELIPIIIFDNTRGYIIKNIVQINTCYQHKAYDACSVLLRKVTEILIIELYEKENIEHKIKDSDGNYFMLKKLISSIQNENEFKKRFTRNTKEILPKIKKNGDLSAHSPKYNATKSDIDLFRNDFRIFFQEFINNIF